MPCHKAGGESNLEHCEIAFNILLELSILSYFVLTTFNAGTSGLAFFSSSVSVCRY